MDKRIRLTHSFPADLARQVRIQWPTLPKSPPPLPDESLLQTLIETAYLASMETEEARSLRFTLCCTASSMDAPAQGQGGAVEAWPFAKDRTFSAQEIRRLSVATNVDTSALWVQFSDNAQEPLTIHGLLNLGMPWTSAPNAFAYYYDSLPEALLLRVEAPGQIAVYCGESLVASLKSGRIQVENQLATHDLVAIDPILREGHSVLREQIPAPSRAVERNWEQYEWLSYVNTVLAVVSAIQRSGHGGALILARMGSRFTSDDYVRIKYRLAGGAAHLSSRFVQFVSQHHRYMDVVSLAKRASDSPVVQRQLLTDYLIRDALHRLAEACAFVGNLASTDGGAGHARGLHR
ncbi:MAG: hypothetical protein M5R40_11905 [Anaerolineae bacterium]|nr:hypothetical protein [Anaerolineae bacterium]